MNVKVIDDEKTQWAHYNGYSLVRLAEHDLKEYGAPGLLTTELGDYLPGLLEGAAL